MSHYYFQSRRIQLFNEDFLVVFGDGFWSEATASHTVIQACLKGRFICLYLLGGAKGMVNILKLSFLFRRGKMRTV